MTAHMRSGLLSEWTESATPLRTPLIGWLRSQRRWPRAVLNRGLARSLSSGIYWCPWKTLSSHRRESWFCVVTTWSDR
jgi:hypothetical protein